MCGTTGEYIAAYYYYTRSYRLRGNDDNNKTTTSSAETKVWVCIAETNRHRQTRGFTAARRWCGGRQYRIEWSLLFACEWWGVCVTIF